MGKGRLVWDNCLSFVCLRENVSHFSSPVFEFSLNRKISTNKQEQQLVNFLQKKRKHLLSIMIKQLRSMLPNFRILRLGILMRKRSTYHPPPSQNGIWTWFLWMTSATMMSWQKILFTIDPREPVQTLLLRSNEPSHVGGFRPKVSLREFKNQIWGGHKVIIMLGPRGMWDALPAVASLKRNDIRMIA